MKRGLPLLLLVVLCSMSQWGCFEDGSGETDGPRPAAPSFSLTRLDGLPVSLEQQRGKTLILDFWATWCGPCMAELPTLKRIHDEFRERDDFLLVSVSSDFDKAVLERTIKDKKLGWHHVYGPDSGGDELSTAFGVRAIPCTILVGKDGKIAAVGLIGESLRHKLDELLGDKKN